MTWVRLQPDLANWPAIAAPPRLHITGDTDGTAVIELAWDPQALLAPASYPDPLRYFNTAVDLAATTVDDDGAARSIAISAQAVPLQGGHTTWVVPADLWSGYLQEARKTLRTPATTSFSRNLYYRVRLTPTGATTATIWPTDDVLNTADPAAAPHLGILLLPTQAAAAAVPDPAAVAAAGGTDDAASRWSDAILYCWNNLPSDDSSALTLASVFSHPVFKSCDTADRGALLKLWLFAGPSMRDRLTEVLDRSTASGTTLVLSTDRSGNGTLLGHLLDLVDITPHPDLIGVLAREHLVDDVLTEIVDPNGQRNRGSGGNMTPSPLQNLMIRVSAAEYARLQTGLLSGAGTATLVGGETLTVPTGGFAAGRHANAVGGNVFLTRTNAELAFQAAVLALGLGTGYPAGTGDPVADNATLQALVATGLSAPAAAAALSALLGAPFSPHQASWPPMPSDPGWLAQQVALAAGLSAELPAKNEQVLVTLFWGRPATDETDITHPVLVTDHTGGRVVFINTDYPRSAPPPSAVKTGTAAAPPRLFEDPALAQESISDADLAGWLFGYLSPDNALT